jgi:glutathione S-transferase
MITLIQFPWSPFCITVRHMLERHGIPYRSHWVGCHERANVIRWTKGRSYTVPCVLDGKRAVADTSDFGQETARYVDTKFKLGLFPKDKEGIQEILARYIEGEVEGIGFKVNDSYVLPKLPLVERTMVILHKERKFGRGCVQQWARERSRLNREMAAALEPFENMLASSPFLLGEKPVFVDYNLFGILGNYLYSGKTRLPQGRNLRRWQGEMKRTRRR